MGAKRELDRIERLVRTGCPAARGTCTAVNMQSSARWPWLLAVVALLILARPSMAAGAELQAVDAEAAAGEGARVTFRFSGQAPQPRAFSTDDPPRVVVDFKDARDARSTRGAKVAAGIVESTRVARSQGRMRAVLQLARPGDYEIRREGDAVFLTVRPVSRPEAQPVAQATRTGPPPGEAAEPRHVLTGLDYASLPGERVQVILRFDGQAPEPSTFSINDPARIVYDLPGTASRLEQTRYSVGVGVTRSIRVAEALTPRGRARTRVIIQLSSLTAHRHEVSGNKIVITLAAMAAEDAAEAEPAARGKAEGLPARRVADIEFRRAPDGAARVQIRLSQRTIPVDVRRSGGRVIVDVANAGLPDRLERRLDVTDFATPVTAVEAYAQTEGDVRIVIETSGEFEYLAYQTNRLYTVEVRRPPEPKDEEKDRFDYTGERISLNFQDIEVRSVLQLLADFTGLNMVVSDSVTGNITLRLQNVPWDQALDIILKTKGLAMRRQGNVILVAPAQEIAEREKQRAEAREQQRELAPLRSEFIQVSYAKATNLRTLLKSEEANLLSERGSVTVDERTNTLLVQDTNERLDEIRDLVQRLDVPVRQVLIESRIVIARNEFSRDLGVRFGVTGVEETDEGVVVGTGSSTGADSVVGQASDNLQNTDNPFPVDPPALGDRLGVDLPAPSQAGSFALAVLGSDYLIDLELSALQAEGRGEVISNPRVITANQKTARIEQGQEIPFEEQTGDNQTSIEFKKAVLSLEVTPRITPDDRINMELAVTKDEVGQQTPEGPAINTREITTEVLVDNGETVVLGGIQENERSKDVTKVPFLGDLPVVGALFRQTRRTDDQRELLIFITPKLINEKLLKTDLQ